MASSTLPRAARVDHQLGIERRREAPRFKVPTMTNTFDDAANVRAARARSGSPFLSPEQAAFYLSVSPRTLQEYRTAGAGPRYRRHSRHIRYHIDDLDAWSQHVGEAGIDA